MIGYRFITAILRRTCKNNNCHHKKKIFNNVENICDKPIGADLTLGHVVDQDIEEKRTRKIRQDTDGYPESILFIQRHGYLRHQYPVKIIKYITQYEQVVYTDGNRIQQFRLCIYQVKYLEHQQWYGNDGYHTCNGTAVHILEQEIRECYIFKKGVNEIVLLLGQVVYKEIKEEIEEKENTTIDGQAKEIPGAFIPEPYNGEERSQVRESQNIKKKLFYVIGFTAKYRTAFK